MIHDRFRYSVMDFTREALLAELELKDDIIEQLRKELDEYRMMNTTRKTAISSEPDIQVKRPIIGKSDALVFFLFQAHLKTPSAFL